MRGDGRFGSLGDKRSSAVEICGYGAATMGDPAGQLVVHIRPRGGWRTLAVSELWSRRWLVWMLAQRDIRVRYAQTVIGILWVVLQPALVAVMLAFTVGRLSGVADAVGGSYLAFAIAGLVPWMVFAHALIHTSNSLVDNERLITKVWFPRLALPLASVLSAACDLLVVGALAALTAPLWGGQWSVQLLLLPVIASLALLAALAVGIWLAAANVFWRDVRYALPFAAQAWMLATPVIWPLSALPEWLRPFAALNPATGPVLGFRWLFNPSTPFPACELAVGTAVSVALLLTGIAIFRRVEARFADAI
ncbi:MAG: ABC transporter permease [Planctomycetota bacterium]